MTYHGRGEFEVSGKRTTYARVGMVAGSTGLTPMYQIAQHCARTKDPLELSLLYANKTPGDILLKDELTALSSLRVAFTVDNGDATWTGYTGFVTAEMLTATMPPPGN